MHAVDAEVVQKGIEIVGGSAGLRTGRWIDDRPPEVPPIESNEAVTCGRERRDLVFPYTHAAGSGVEEYRGYSASAGVREPESNSGQLGISLARGSRRCPLERNETAGAHAEQRNRDDPSYPGTESMHHFFRHGFLPPRCLPLIGDDDAAHDRELRPQHVPVALERITVEDNDVGQLACFQRAELVAHFDV